MSTLGGQWDIQGRGVCQAITYVNVWQNGTCLSVTHKKLLKAKGGQCIKTISLSLPFLLSFLKSRLLRSVTAIHTIRLMLVTMGHI